MQPAKRPTGPRDDGSCPTTDNAMLLNLVALHSKPLSLQQLLALINTSKELRPFLLKKNHAVDIEFYAKDLATAEQFAAWLGQYATTASSLDFDISTRTQEDREAASAAIAAALQQAAAASDRAPLQLQSCALHSLSLSEGCTILDVLAAMPHPNPLTSLDATLYLKPEEAQPKHLAPVAKILPGLSNLRSLSLQCHQADELASPWGLESTIEGLLPALSSLTHLTRLVLPGLSGNGAICDIKLPQLLELEVTVDGEFRWEAGGSLAHLTSLTRLVSMDCSLMIDDTPLPPSLVVLETGTCVSTGDLLSLPKLEVLAMKESSTRAAELQKLTSLTGLKDVKLTYIPELDSECYINAAAAGWAGLPISHLELGWQDEAVSADTVRHLGSLSSSLTSLTIDDCIIGAAPEVCAEVLGQLTNLQQLKLNHLKWSSEVVAEAKAAVKDSSSGGHGMECVAAAIGQLPGLTSLTMTHCLDDAHVLDLAPCLARIKAAGGTLDLGITAARGKK